MPDAIPPAPRRWSEGRILFWFVLLLLAGALFGPPYLEAFRPPSNKVGDFHQEWLSARNFAEGGKVYANQRTIAGKYLGAAPEVAENFLPWNAHPPVSVLLALPLGKLSYSDAQLAWNLANLPLLILAIVLVVRETGMPFQTPSILPLLVLLVGWHSLYSQIQHAQLNIVLMLLITSAWVLDRRGQSYGAGAALGAAAAVKLFPAFLFLYFLANRNWKAIAAGAATFLALNGIALAILGLDEFQTYIRDVVPTLANYQSSRQNVSLAGFWLRIFDPHPNEHVIAAIQQPLLGAIFSYGSRVAVAVLVAWVGWNSRTPFDRDRAFALAVIGLLLVSPIAWPHYFLILAMPLAFLWQNLRGRPFRIAFWVAFLVLWLPNYYFPSLVLGKEVGMTLFLMAASDVSPVHNLALMSLPHYALLGLFALVLAVRPSAATVPSGDAP